MEIRPISSLVNISMFVLAVVALFGLHDGKMALAGVCAYSIFMFHFLRERLRKAVANHDAEHERCIARGVQAAMRKIDDDERKPDEILWN